MLKVIQITDCHLGASQDYTLKGINTYQTLKAVLHDVINEAPNFLIGTGDLSEDASLESYQLLKDLLNSTGIPYLLLPGNHDAPEYLKSIFAERACIDTSLSFASWNFIFLNSVVPGKHFGFITKKTLQYLNETLKNTSSPIGVFVHHQPFHVTNQFLNQYDIQNAKELREIFEKNTDKLKFVAFGHIHSEFFSQVNGVTYYASPATSMQFRDSIDKLLIDYDKQPGYRVFNLSLEDIISTYVKFIHL